MPRLVASCVPPRPNVVCVQSFVCAAPVLVAGASGNQAARRQDPQPNQNEERKNDTENPEVIAAAACARLRAVRGSVARLACIANAVSTAVHVRLRRTRRRSRAYRRWCRTRRCRRRTHRPAAFVAEFALHAKVVTLVARIVCTRAAGDGARLLADVLDTVVIGERMVDPAFVGVGARRTRTRDRVAGWCTRL